MALRTLRGSVRRANVSLLLVVANFVACLSFACANWQHPAMKTFTFINHNSVRGIDRDFLICAKSRHIACCCHRLQPGRLQPVSLILRR